MVQSCAPRDSSLRALVPLQLQKLWLRSINGPLLLESSPICAHLRPIIIVSSRNCQCSVSCSRSSCQETCHDARSWQVFIFVMVPMLHISTNTSDRRGGKDHHVSAKEDGRRTAREGRQNVVATPSLHQSKVVSPQITMDPVVAGVLLF